MGHRNFAHDQNTTTLSYRDPFPNNHDIEAIDHVISEYHFKKGVFNKSHPLKLTRLHQNHTNVQVSLLSDGICVTIATDILSFSGWNYINCDQPIQMPYVICEKENSNILKHITRAAYECHSREVVHNNTICLALKRTCKPTALGNVVFLNNKTHGNLTHLGRWAMGLTFQIGYRHKNATHALCLEKLQKCCYNKHSQWKNPSICPSDQVSHWRCLSNIQKTSTSCKSSEFQCHDGVCIADQYRCDSTTDCPDGSDEVGCNEVCTLGTECFTGCKALECSCSYNYIQDDGKCEPLYWRYAKLLSTSRLNMYQIGEMEEHVFNSDIACPNGWARCTSGDVGSCYPNEKLCVFERNIIGTPLYCRNTEHLAECFDYPCPTQFKCRQSFCIPIYMVCDGVVDCPDQEDEASTLCMYIKTVVITKTGIMAIK